jgi:hypothetical protein
VVRVLIAAAAVVAFGLMSAPPTVAATAAVVGNEHWVAPTASVDRIDVPSTTWNAGNSCYYPDCTAAHKDGEGDIPSSGSHYCAKQDRDGDGIACEW